MELKFSWKYKNYELRAVPKSLVRLRDEDKNETIELIKWDDEEGGFCFTIY